MAELLRPHVVDMGDGHAVQRLADEVYVIPLNIPDDHDLGLCLRRNQAVVRLSGKNDPDLQHGASAGNDRPAILNICFPLSPINPAQEVTQGEWAAVGASAVQS